MVTFSANHDKRLDIIESAIYTQHVVAMCVAWVGLAGFVLAPVVSHGQDAEAVYKKALPSVMTLKVKTKAGGVATGTAFLALRDGCAITAWHVVADAETVVAHFSDGQEFEVSGLIDKDERRDVAAIRVKVADRPLLSFASGEPEVGSKVFVLGAPKGLEFSFTDGIVSQVRSDGRATLYQYSAETNPGNSGGPLLNLNGDVLGIVSWKLRDTQNVNFAVAATYAKGLDLSLATQAWSTVKSSPIEVATGADDGLAASKVLSLRVRANAFSEARWDLERDVVRVRSNNLVIPQSAYNAVEGLRQIARELRAVKFSSSELNSAVAAAADSYDRGAAALVEMTDAAEYAIRNGWAGRANSAYSAAVAKLGFVSPWEDVLPQLFKLTPKEAFEKYHSDLILALYGDGSPSRPTLWPSLSSLRMRLDIRFLPKLIVSAVDPNGPAGKADIRPSDEIIEVDGKSMDDWTAFDTYLRANAGKAISLKVRRLKGGEAKLKLSIPK